MSAARRQLQLYLGPRLALIGSAGAGLAVMILLSLLARYLH